MRDHLDDELAALRARAYGAGADIHDDPVALERLRVLEERARSLVVRVRPPLPASSAEAAASAASLPHASGAVASSALLPGTAADADGDPSRPPASPGETRSPAESRSPAVAPGARARRPLVLAAAAGAVVAALIAVPLTLWAASDDDAPYAVLQRVNATPDMTFFSPESQARVFEEFHGLRVTTGRDGRSGRCILIELAPDAPDSWENGTTRGNCTAPGFEVVGDIALSDPSVPEGVRRQLPEITGVRFVEVGDEIHVFVARGRAAQAAPARP